MPQLFRISGYRIYFWTNEGDPIEPIHVHISEGNPSSNTTKIWILSSGKCKLANNNSKIPQHFLNNAMKVIETRADYIIKMWKKKFGEVKFYC